MTLSLVLSLSALGVAFYSAWARQAPPETITVIGIGRADGQFDRADITVSVMAEGSDLSQAVGMIQSRVTTAGDALIANGIGGVKTSFGSGYAITPNVSYESGVYTSTLTIQRSVTFTIENETGPALSNKTQRVLGVLQSYGLFTQTQGVSGTSSVVYGFSDASMSRLHDEASAAAVQNATLRAEAFAKAEGLHLGSVTQMTELPQAESQLLGIASFPPYAYGTNTTPSVEDDVQVTFTVTPA
jgi:uncharacterized protein YggE